MANEKDIFIRDTLKRDDLISKKADDVFNNFFKTTIHRIEVSNSPEFVTHFDEENQSDELLKNEFLGQQKEVFQEVSKLREIQDVQANNTAEEVKTVEGIETDKTAETAEKSDNNVINFEEERKKRKGGRKFLSAVASLAIVFCVSNVYATTRGYDNIFFMIKNMIVHEEVTDKEEILVDKDLTISYQSIEIAEGVKLQINKLTVTANEATLYLSIDENDSSIVHPKRFIIYDITDENSEVIGNQEIKGKEHTKHTEEISLNGMKNTTEKLKLEIRDEHDSEIVSLELDLNNKEIDVTSNMITEIQKLSEVELKEVLAKYLILNSVNDFYSTADHNYSDEELLNTQKVLLAIKLITNSEDEFSLETVNKAIEEFCGEKYENELAITDDIIFYNTKKKEYEFYPGDYYLDPLCLKIENISFMNGVYTVTLDYCYPTDQDWEEGTIESLDIFKTTLKFKLNPEYDYTKYCLIDVNNIESEKVEK